MPISNKRALAIAKVMASDGVLSETVPLENVKNIIKNVFDAKENEALPTAELERDDQMERVCAELRDWMRSVYSKRPRLENGDLMKLEIIGDMWGNDEQNDYERFSFSLVRTDPAVEIY